MAAPQPLRVAIVGVGPKGLYCLERLLARTRAAQPRRPLRVELFEPTGQFGAGAVYSVDQEPYLSMNFADPFIDAWPRDLEAAVPPSARLSFAQWLAQAEPEEGGPRPPRRDGYSPRALVGGYLRWCFASLQAAAPDHASLHLHAARASRIERDAGGWRLVAEAADGERQVLFCDEVVLATGHAPGGSSVTSAFAYPLNGALSADRIPPGAAVHVRGMALTSIDVALSLTEGRGGRFVADSRARAGLRYEPSGEEVGSITLYSRTGRTMCVKPDPERVRVPESWAGVLDTESMRLRDTDGFDVDAALIPTLAATAARLLAVASGGPPTAPNGRAERIEAALRARLRDRHEAPARALARLGRSREVAVGVRRPDAAWALGEAWRGLYPAIVDRTGHGGVAEDDWPAFAALAREMERIAFGPPPGPAAKMMTLVGAGKLMLAPAPAQPRAGASAASGWIDAVLAPPGLGRAAPEPVASLLGGGHLRRAPGARRGIEVAGDATCIGRDGAPSHGLAAVGRITEDWVVGNDTLSRRLHSHPDRWARRVVGRL